MKPIARQRALGCRTCLVQVGRKACRTGVRNAGDRAQVFIDGLDVIVRHVAMDRPRHDLENIGGKGRRSNATLHPHLWASWVRIIEVVTGANDGQEILERRAAFGQRVGTRRTCAPWRQVPAIDVQPCGRPRRDEFPCSGKRAERCAAGQIRGSILHLGLSEEGIVAGSPHAAEPGIVVAAVAEALCVDDVTAFSHQSRI